MKVTEIIKNFDGTDATEQDGKGGMRPMTYRSAMVTGLCNVEKDETYDVKRRLHRLCELIYDQEEPKFVAEDIVEINKRVNNTFRHPRIPVMVARFLEPNSEANK